MQNILPAGINFYPGWCLEISPLIFFPPFCIFGRMIHRTPPLKMVDVITVLEQSHRAEQDSVSEILRLFLEILRLFESSHF